VVDACFRRRHFGGGGLLVLVGIFLPAASLIGQTTPGAAHRKAPAQSRSTASAPLPEEVQRKLDQLLAELKSARAVGNRSGEAKLLSEIGDLYYGVPNYPEGLAAYNRATILAHSAGDARLEVAAMNGLAKNQPRLDDSLALYQKALTLAKKSGDLQGQATALNGMGSVHHRKGLNSQALGDLQRAIELARLARDADLEARVLWNTGIVDGDTGQQQAAMDSYMQAMSIYRAAGDDHRVAATLERIGVVYSAMGDQQQALRDFNDALPILRAAHDQFLEVDALANAAVVYSLVGEKQKALEYFKQTLVLLRSTGDLQSQTDILSISVILLQTGVVYADLGEKQKALDCYRQALPGLRAGGDRVNEASALEDMGMVYRDLGERRKALMYYNRALPMFRDARDVNDMALTLDYIGVVYRDLGERQRALTYYNQALPMLRKASDRNGEALTLDYIGVAYDGLGEKQKALANYKQALPIAIAVGDPLLEAGVYRDLLINCKDAQPALAIFYGKQAVNSLQQLRDKISGLDKKIQSTFLASKSDYYHDLADLLIVQGRLPEAEQVLDLLKEQEYSDYVRDKEVQPGDPLSLTPAEQEAEKEYQRSTAQLVTIGKQWAQLKDLSSPTPEQKQQLKELSDQLHQANQGLADYYARLYVALGNDSSANKQQADVKGKVSKLKDEIADPPDTVALYTMVTGDHYRVIVVSPAATVARESTISGKELNQKVADFEQALRNPASDPKPLAQELYKILVGPVKGDLDQAPAKTLVWWLDGVLRYVPIAALYDGKHYMVENYNTVTITPASIDRLEGKPDVTNLSALAMGISRKYEIGLDQLPSVVSELDDIVKDPQVQAAHGVISGSILLNDQFTESAMETQLNGKPHVVHIASHFVFKPGNDDQSYLLLAGKDQDAGGFHLTVAELRDNENLTFKHTDLLTLSACETGMSGNASNGREVDGLGTTAQLKGAKAVMSSLWSVNDASTGLLMGDFYKRWAEGEGKVEKVEALRQAQLDLLLGKVTPDGGAGGRGFSAEAAASETPKGYAHPYYWAPFVLMGNWR